MCDLSWKTVLAEFESLSSGFKFQSEVNSFSWWPQRDCDKVRKGVELGLGPKQACGMPWTRCTGEDTLPVSAHFWPAGQLHMLMYIQQHVQDRTCYFLYSSTWLSGFPLTFLHCCSFLLSFFPSFLPSFFSFLPSFLSFVNPKKSVWQLRCTFWLLLFPSLWPLQILTLYFQLRARPTPAHHHPHWERLLCHFFVTIFQDWHLVGRLLWKG